MSLVNDMLRDLDQRRKESEGSAGHVSLTPAPEQYKEMSKRPVWLYLGLALLVAGGAIAFFWLQQGETDAARTLNIRTPLVVQPQNTEAESAESEAATNAANEKLTATAAGSASQAPERGETELAANIAAPLVNTIEVAETAATLNQTADETSPGNGAIDAESALGNQVEPALAAAAAESAGQSIVTEAGQLSGDSAVTANLNDDLSVEIAQVESTEVESVESAMSNKMDTEDASATASEGPILAANMGGETAVVDLSASPVESVKNSARMTPEERDTTAVQAALGFIAENNTTAAYSRLEQELLQNRYAHQSRETYAKLLMRQGDAYSALELINSGLELAPNHAGYKKVKARILMAAGEIEAATDLLMRRAPPIGEDIEYHDILATAQLANRDYEGALISYTSLVQQDRSQGKWWYGFAASQDSLGNGSAARQAYSQAIQLSNLSPSLRARSQERLISLSQ